MSEIKLTGQNYDVNKTSNYIVSILLSQNGLFFSIRDYLSNCYVHLEHYPEVRFQHNFEEVQQIVAEKFQENMLYKEVHLVLDDPRVTFIPTVLANVELNQHSFDLNYEIQPDENLATFQHKHGGITSVFPVKEEIKEYFQHFFGQVKMLHLCDAATWYALSYHGTIDEHFTIILQKDHFYLVGAKKDKLLINSHFHYHTDDDFLFFLLNAFKQFEFDQYEAKLFLTGDVDSGNSKIEKLRKFVKNVEFEAWPTNFNYSDAFFSVPAHRYFHLLIASNCE